VPFHQYWLKMRRQAGAGGRPGRYSRSTAWPRAGKVHARRPDMPELAAGRDRHAFHFDAGLYARYLRRYAEARGVQRIEGKIAQVQQRSRAAIVTAVVLETASASRASCSSTAPASAAC
jgi:tryptophan halogenase